MIGWQVVWRWTEQRKWDDQHYYKDNGVHWQNFNFYVNYPFNKSRRAYRFKQGLGWYWWANVWPVLSIGSHTNGAPDISLPWPQHERSWGQVRLAFNLSPRGRRTSFLVVFKTMSSPFNLHNHILSLVLASLHIISASLPFAVPSISAFLPLVIAHVKRSRKFAVRMTPSLCWRTAWLVATWLGWRRSRYFIFTWFIFLSVYCTLYFI